MVVEVAEAMIIDYTKPGSISAVCHDEWNAKQGSVGP